LAGARTASPVCIAVAHAGAWINLFNLILVWKLDGGRGFRAPTRSQRGIALATAVAMWTVTQESMLLLVSLGKGYRILTKDYAAEPDRGALFQYAGPVAALSRFGFCAAAPHFRTFECIASASEYAEALKRLRRR
jgi:Zn-dependent protease